MQGVKVKLLLDAIGSSSIGEDILQTLKTGECQIAWFNPIRWYSLGRFNNRTHRKSLIIDGCVAFTGGCGNSRSLVGKRAGPRALAGHPNQNGRPAVVPAANRLCAKLARDYRRTGKWIRVLSASERGREASSCKRF